MLESNINISYVLFGATGNLAQIKILPALCALFEKGELKTGSKVVAIGRREWRDDEYRSFIRPSLKGIDEKVIDGFLNCVVFVNGTFEDASLYEKIKQKVENSRVFYHLAVLPISYADIIKGLGKTGLKGKLLIEKPFGNSFESAESLENLIENFFDEKDILRIDHYLGKAGLQNIIEKRKSDTVLESKLNNESVLKIVCQLREVIDIAGRGEFYDKVGAFIDVGQNHALELVATLLMELKGDLSLARKKVIESLTLMPRSIIRGQYEGYKEEKNVDPQSMTETYFRFALQSTLSKWSDIEIIVEAGKALEAEERKEEVIVDLKDGSNIVFNIDIPKHYNAYEAVIGAAFSNDLNLFVGKDEVYTLWNLADKIREDMVKVPLITYKKGNGPKFIN